MTTKKTTTKKEAMDAVVEMASQELVVAPEGYFTAAEFANEKQISRWRALNILKNLVEEGKLVSIRTPSSTGGGKTTWFGLPETKK